MIPTAKEFIQQKDDKTGPAWSESTQELADAFIEFAKIHLIAQQDAILKLWELRGGYNNVEKNIIQNAYPLKNVK